MKIGTITVLAVLATPLLLCAQDPRPNVMIIMVDDMGWSDLGCYGGECQTPQIDALAANGLRFREFYTIARCSPTRVSFLTGLYPQQAAHDPGAALPHLRGDNNITIAELLRDHGYRTYMAGKWHVGADGQDPWDRGFEHFWGFPRVPAKPQWLSNHYVIVSQNNEIPLRSYPGDSFYQTDAIGDYTIDFVDHHLGKGDGKPFFAYMSFGAPHSPIQAPGAVADSYMATYQQGWDVVRQQRYDRMLAQGVIDARYPLTPRGGTAPHQTEPIELIPAWNTIAADRQADLVRRMALYTAMIEKVDDNVKKVVDHLDLHGLLDNTLLFFLSDNGGNHEHGVYGTWNVPASIEEDPVPAGEIADMGQASANDDLHYGGGWANVSNTPLRLFKHSMHGGGSMTPLIVHWPDGFTRTNEWEEQPGHMIDLMPTIIEATGSTYPTFFDGHAVLPMEGTSLVPALEGLSLPARTIYGEHEVNRMVRTGKWKFVNANFVVLPGGSSIQEIELYDMSVDPAETNNLAIAEPSQTTQMLLDWNAWALRVGLPENRRFALPAPAPEAGPATADLFLDTFERPPEYDADATADGMSGSRVSPIGAGAAYYEGYNASGGSGATQVLGGVLQLATGGASESGVMHNFTGADIVAAGGFSVQLDVVELKGLSGDMNTFAGFGVGLTEAEAAAGGRIGSQAPPFSFRGQLGVNTGVADFFVDLSQDGFVNVWSHGAVLERVPVGKLSGRILAAFELDGFSTLDSVSVSVWLDGVLLDINSADPTSHSRTFSWGSDDMNYIGLSARTPSWAWVDSFAVRKLPLAEALATNYAADAGLDGESAAPMMDSDGDGSNNFEEWLKGADPAESDAEVKLLQLVRGGAGDFRFETRAPVMVHEAGFYYVFKWSPDLVNWTNFYPEVYSITPLPGGTHQRIGYQLPAGIRASDRVYIKLEVR